MDAEAALKPWLRPSALCALVDQLRKAGFGVDLRHYQRVQSLAIAVTASRISDDDASRLRDLLAPIVCRSAVEQNEFPRLFDRWAGQLAEGQFLPGPSPIQKTLQEAQRRSRRWLWVILFLLAIFATFATWLFLSLRTPAVATPSPAPVPAPGSITGGLGWAAWAAIAILSVVAAISAWLALWYRMGRQVLQRESTTERPKVDTLKVTSKIARTYDPHKVARIASACRVRVPALDSELSVVETIERTVRNGGLRSPVLRPRRVFPEYLALIERVDPADHQAARVDEILTLLSERGVYITRYYFQEDPRVCVPQRGTDETLSLRGLSQRFSRHRLMLFTGTATFRDPSSGQIAAYVSDCTAWAERAVFETGVEQRGAFEQDLAQHLTILPATLDGVLAWVASLQLNGRVLPPRGIEATELPSAVADDPEQWLTRLEPDRHVVERLLASLRAHLSPRELVWLSACAVYPSIAWNLTVAMGHTLDEGNPQLLPSSERLATIARLPWFRYGYMPDWLRSRLVDALPRSAEQTTRRTLDSLLLSSLHGESGDFALDIANARSPVLGRLGSAVRRVLRRGADAPDELRDYVYVRFMSGRKIRPLAVRIPDALRTVIGTMAQNPDATRLEAANDHLPIWQRRLTAFMYWFPPLALARIAAGNLYVRFNAIQTMLLWIVALTAAAFEPSLVSPATIVYFSVALYPIALILRGRIPRLPLIGRLAWRLADWRVPDLDARSAVESAQRAARAAAFLSFTGPLGWLRVLRRDWLGIVLLALMTIVPSVCAVYLAAGGINVMWHVAAALLAVATWHFPFAIRRFRSRAFGAAEKIPPHTALVLWTGPLGWLIALRGFPIHQILVASGTLVGLGTALVLAGIGDGIDFYSDDLWDYSGAFILVTTWHWPFAFRRLRLLAFTNEREAIVLPVPLTLWLMATGPIGWTFALRRRPAIAAFNLASVIVLGFVAVSCFNSGDGIDFFMDDFWEIGGVALAVATWFGPFSSKLYRSIAHPGDVTFDARATVLGLR